MTGRLFPWRVKNRSYFCIWTVVENNSQLLASRNEKDTWLGEQAGLYKTWYLKALLQTRHAVTPQCYLDYFKLIHWQKKLVLWFWSQSVLSWIYIHSRTLRGFHYMSIRNRHNLDYFLLPDKKGYYSLEEGWKLSKSGGGGCQGKIMLFLLDRYDEWEMGQKCEWQFIKLMEQNT